MLRVILRRPPVRELTANGKRLKAFVTRNYSAPRETVEEKTTETQRTQRNTEVIIRDYTDEISNKVIACAIEPLDDTCHGGVSKVPNRLDLRGTPCSPCLCGE